MTATIYPPYQESKGIKIMSHGGKSVFDNFSLTPLSSTWALKEGCEGGDVPVMIWDELYLG